jgi:hypothetical protein
MIVSRESTSVEIFHLVTDLVTVNGNNMEWKEWIFTAGHFWHPIYWSDAISPIYWTSLVSQGLTWCTLALSSG